MVRANEIEVVVRGRDDSEVVITKTTKRAQEAAEAIRRSGDTAAEGFRRTRQGADEAAGGLDKFGEAGDTVDTRAMGFRDTLTGVQDSMLGVSEIARGNLFAGFLALGAGIGDLGSGVYNFLVPSMQSARGSMADTAGTAVKAGEAVAASQTAAAAATVGAQSRMKSALASTAGFLGGPWGAAFLTAGAVLGAFVAHKLRVNREIEELGQSLHQETGAITGNTRAWVANTLERDGLLETAERLGISSGTMVDAVLGEADALDAVNQKLDEASELRRKFGSAYDANAQAADALRGRVDGLGGELEKAREAHRRKRAAVDGDTASTEANTTAVLDNADALKEAADPAFALIRAQQRLSDAQDRYNDAVREHGENSKQARRASVDLAEALLGARAAASKAGSTLSGPTRQALVATMRAGGATEDQIREVMRAFDAAAAAGRRFAKKYTAEIHYFYTSSGRRVEAGIVGTGVVPGRAHGGIHGGGLAVVGEHGPELAELPAGTSVIPAGTTANMLAGGGQPVVVNLYIERTGERWSDALMEMLAERIRVEGGNVQQVLGS